MVWLNGLQIAYEELMKTIEKRYPELDPANVPLVFAPWTELI
jgi:hypothetical protein